MTLGVLPLPWGPAARTCPPLPSSSAGRPLESPHVLSQRKGEVAGKTLKEGRSPLARGHPGSCGRPVMTSVVCLPRHLPRKAAVGVLHGPGAPRPREQERPHPSSRCPEGARREGSAAGSPPRPGCGCSRRRSACSSWPGLRSSRWTAWRLRMRITFPPKTSGKGTRRPSFPAGSPRPAPLGSRAPSAFPRGRERAS